MDDFEKELLQMLRNHVPAALSAEEIAQEVPLGTGGLGMDSVAVVMLLLECETRWGVAFPAEMLEQPLTIDRMVRHLTDHRAT